MPPKPDLRAVDPGETPPPAQPPESLADAIASGDQLRILRATQRELGESLPNEKGPAKAAMFRHLIEVGEKIATLEAAAAGRAKQEGSRVSDDDGVGDAAFDAEAI